MNGKEISASEHSLSSLESRHQELGAHRNEIFNELVDVALTQNSVIGSLEQEKISLEEMKEKCDADMSKEKATLNAQIESCENVVKSLQGNDDKSSIIQEMEKDLRNKIMEHDRCIDDYFRVRTFLDTMEIWSPLVFLPHKSIKKPATPLASPGGSAAALYYVPLPDAGYGALLVGLVAAAAGGVLARLCRPAPRTAPAPGIWIKLALRVRVHKKSQTIILRNTTGKDLDLSGCILQITGTGVEGASFEFEDGYMLGSATSVKLHCSAEGAAAHRSGGAGCLDHELYDSRTRPHLPFPAGGRVFEELGGARQKGEVGLLDAKGKRIVRAAF